MNMTEDMEKISEYIANMTEADILEMNMRIEQSWRESEDYKRFYKHYDAWIEETQFLSDPDQIYHNDHFMKIVGMGYHAIPMIVDLLEQGSNIVMTALIYIEDYSPEIEWDGKSSLVEQLRQFWLNYYK